MAKMQVTCPRCRQPILAEVEQVFDLNVDPKAKQRFLSGSANMAECKACGYQGPLSLPQVYHDPDKELLLTFFPPELGLPLNEQEKLIGPLIKQVVDKLPNEKRKAYLFRPQTMLTFQTMLDKVLESDGITREMIDASQKRINLIQRLLQASSKDVRAEIVKQEEPLVDETFYAMISRLVEASLANGDQNSARALAALQQELLPLTEAGRKLQAESGRVQEAVKELQELAKSGLTREALADFMIKHRASPAVINSVAPMIRQGMDYEFFGLLSSRADAASAEEKASINELRDTLLELTKRIDEAVGAQMEEAQKLLEEILKAPSVEQSAAEHLGEMDEFFSQVLRSELAAARKAGNYERSGRLQAIVDVIQKASAPPPEYQLIEELIGLEDEAALREALEKNADKITPQFTQLLSGLAAQMEGQGDPEAVGRIQRLNSLVTRMSMEKNLRG